MKTKKFLILVLFLFLFVLGTFNLAFADRVCTYEVDSSNGYQRLVSHCETRRTQKTEIYRNPNDLRFLVEKLLDGVKRAIENVRERMANIRFGQDRSKEMAVDIRRRAQISIETQRTKQEDQKRRLETLKMQAEMQKQRQKDLIENLRSRTQR